MPVTVNPFLMTERAVFDGLAANLRQYHPEAGLHKTSGGVVKLVAVTGQIWSNLRHAREEPTALVRYAHGQVIKRKHKIRAEPGHPHEVVNRPAVKPRLPFQQRLIV